MKSFRALTKRCLRPFVALALLSPVLAHAVALPGGRPNYVVGMFGGATTTTRWSIIRNLAFSTNGTVTSVSWVWAQNTFTGDATTNKIYTGYTTAGGQYNGVVKTPKGFQPGAAGTSLSGTFGYDGNGDLAITWSSGKTETWRMSTPKPYPYTMITCIGSNYSVRKAWGFGSQAALYGTGATIAQIKAAGDLSFKDEWYNAYNAADGQNTVALLISGHNICSSTAMMNNEPQAPCHPNRWHSYIAGNPTQDGRKTFWNQQRGLVTCSEDGAPCPTPNDTVGTHAGHPCTSQVLGYLGGHTYAFFQVLDDNGVFRGFVGAEASLHARATGNAIVGASYWMQP